MDVTLSGVVVTLALEAVSTKQDPIHTVEARNTILTETKDISMNKAVTITIFSNYD